HLFVSYLDRILGAAGVSAQTDLRHLAYQHCVDVVRGHADKRLYRDKVVACCRSWCSDYKVWSSLLDPWSIYLRLLLGRHVKLAVLRDSGAALFAFVFAFFDKRDSLCQLFVRVFVVDCRRAFVLFLTLVAVVFHEPVLVQTADAGKE